MRITIDESRCIAAGQCVLNAPELFDQRDEDGIVVLLDANPPEAEQPAARLAAQLCPAQVITTDD
jgi:ferredoxin